MSHIKHLLFFTFLIYGSCPAHASQKKSKNTAQLVCDYKKISDDEYDLVFHVTLKKGQYVKASNDYDSVSSFKLPTFTFDKSSTYSTIGEIESKGLIETKKIKRVGIVNVYSYSVLYNQRVKAQHGCVIRGTYNYQVCNEKKTKHEKTEKFSVTIK
jgi:hypothetical protein